MPWKPTNEIRWERRKVSSSVGIDYIPVPIYLNVLQQRFVFDPEGAGFNMDPLYEWYDVPIVEASLKIVSDC